MNNNVKERPILFSGDMIRALLQEYSMPGQYKNQTRRTHGLHRFNDFPKFLEEKGWEIQEFIEESPGWWLAISNDEDGDALIPVCKIFCGSLTAHLWGTWTL